jgi:hypothetical protein
MSPLKLFLLPAIASLWCLPAVANNLSPDQAVSDAMNLEKPFTVPKVAPDSIPKPLFLKSTPTADANGQPEDKAAAAERIKMANDESMTRATWWIARWTIVLALVAVLQIAMFLRQLKLTRDSVEDAKVAAYAAKASADSLPRIERAYLFASISFAGALREIDEDDEEYDVANPRVVGRIKVKITNHGKTPAVLTSFDRYPVFGQLAPQHLVSQDEKRIQIPDGIVVAAGEPFRTSIRLDLDQERWNQLKSQKLTMYCVGAVTYDDVLGNSHMTGFCWHAHDLLSQSPRFTITRSTKLNTRT